MEVSVPAKVVCQAVGLSWPGIPLASVTGFTLETGGSGLRFHQGSARSPGARDGRLLPGLCGELPAPGSCAGPAAGGR